MRSAAGTDNTAARQKLVDRLRAVGVSERVASALMRVPRDRFVPADLKPNAWSDRSLPIGSGQTISQPSLVGRMIDLLRTQSHHVVLDVGTGSGYQAAVLSLLVKRVIGVERVSELRLIASKRLADLGYRNVHVFDAGDQLGWTEAAPYDGIIVGAAAPEIPHALVEQLKIGGMLVVPVGSRREQRVVTVLKTADGVEETHHEYVRFVPLVGEGAWQ